MADLGQILGNCSEQSRAKHVPNVPNVPHVLNVPNTNIVPGQHRLGQRHFRTGSANNVEAIMACTGHAQEDKLSQEGRVFYPWPGGPKSIALLSSVNFK